MRFSFSSALPLVFALAACAETPATIDQEDGSESQAKSGFSIEAEFATQSESCLEEGINLIYNCRLTDAFRTQNLYVASDEVLSYIKPDDSIGSKTYALEDVRFPLSGKFQRTRTYFSELGPTREAFWATARGDNITIHISGVADQNSHTIDQKTEFRITLKGDTCEVDYFVDEKGISPPLGESLISTGDKLKHVNRAKWTDTIFCEITPGNIFQPKAL